jgi:hypothetical protein
MAARPKRRTKRVSGISAAALKGAKEANDQGRRPDKDNPSSPDPTVRRAAIDYTQEFADEEQDWRRAGGGKSDGTGEQ